MREFMIIKLRIYHQKCKLLVYNVKKIEQRTEGFQQTETWCQLYINVKFLSLLHSTSLAQERVSMDNACWEGVRYRNRELFPINDHP